MNTIQDSLTPANTYTIVGIVAGVYPPATTANGKLRPAILELDSKKYGKCNFAFFQLWENKVRTENLPPEWEQIVKVQDWVMGKQIAVTASFKDIYGDTSNFQNPVAVEFLEDDPPLPPEPVTTVTPVTTPAVAPYTAPMATPAPQSVSPFTLDQRIAWHGAVNLAVPLARKPVEPPVEPTADDLEHRKTSISNWIERVDELAWPLYLLKTRGPVPVKPVQLTPEEELFSEATDLGVVGQTGEI